MLRLARMNCALGVVATAALLTAQATGQTATQARAAEPGARERAERLQLHVDRYGYFMIVPPRHWIVKARAQAGGTKVRFTHPEQRATALTITAGRLESSLRGASLETWLEDQFRAFETEHPDQVLEPAVLTPARAGEMTAIAARRRTIDVEQDLLFFTSGDVLFEVGLHAADAAALESARASVAESLDTMVVGPAAGARPSPARRARLLAISDRLVDDGEYRHAAAYLDLASQGAADDAELKQRKQRLEALAVILPTLWVSNAVRRHRSRSSHRPIPAAPLQTVSRSAPPRAEPSAPNQAQQATASPVATRAVPARTVAAAVAAPMPAPVATGERFTLQAGAFRKRAGAEALRSRLEHTLADAYILTVQRNGEPLHRVRVGSFASRPRARAAAARAAEAGYEVIVVPFESTVVALH